VLGCGKAPRCAQDYQAKLSGPLLDRIDLHVDVPAVSATNLALPPPSEGSAQVAARVARAREIQRRHYDALGPEGTKIGSNAEADGEILDKVATPDQSGRNLLTRAVENFKLSARGYHRVLRAARTLADLAGKDGVGQSEIAEALSYRRVGVGR
jgi:magnesium chelatase family protein